MIEPLKHTNTKNLLEKCISKHVICIGDICVCRDDIEKILRDNPNQDIIVVNKDKKSTNSQSNY